MSLHGVGRVGESRGGVGEAENVDKENGGDEGKYTECFEEKRKLSLQIIMLYIPTFRLVTSTSSSPYGKTDQDSKISVIPTSLYTHTYWKIPFPFMFPLATFSYMHLGDKIHQLDEQGNTLYSSTYT